MHRTHGASFAPWWFGSRGHGRFDLADPRGTCYAAESEQVTLLETWGGIRVIPSTELVGRAISRLELAADRRVADLTSNLAVQFGVTAEIFTTVDYHLTQLWAAALDAAGYDGVRYWARHDLTHDHACVALFDGGGDRTRSTTSSSDYVVARTDKLSARGDVFEELRVTSGIAVLAIPHSL
ncbi:RES domain-containing protein [Rhodococcus spelaei]|uniref:RES domain-containing protein n=1 Tax=Rhodococcus spelaei TaxID=2546320 RepID=A0A541B827_9NOCA|nr:RES domain-containing protein [Rhodococcus spelaei]